MDRIDACTIPPGDFIANAMSLTMMNPTKGNDEFIAYFAAQRSRLHEAEMVGIGMFSPTQKTRLFSDKAQMLLAAMPTRLANRKNALVDTGWRVNFRLNRSV